MNAPKPKRRSLLLVEENVSIARPLRDWLTLVFPNVRLIETTEHPRSIPMHRSQTPDVVLMDISRLGKRGVDEVRAMKAAQPSSAVFALVTMDNDAYRRELREAGAEACAAIWQLRTELLPLLQEHLSTEEGESLAKPVALELSACGDA